MPIAAWLLRNVLVLDDATGAAAKLAALRWTVKPFGQLLDHPIFTPGGLAYFWGETLHHFWRGEIVWKLAPLALHGWVHSGFSVHGEQTVPTEDVQGAERLARYLTRGPVPLDVVEKVEGGRLRVRTPPDPRTGLVEKILDPRALARQLGASAEAHLRD